MRDRVKVYFDGGCRPLPMGMETAVVVRGVSYIRRELGVGSSMAAEWLALIHAIAVAGELGVAAPLLLGDALAVIGQATGAVRCPPAFLHYRRIVLAACPTPRLRYVKRTQNLAGIALARLHR